MERDDPRELALHGGHTRGSYWTITQDAAERIREMTDHFVRRQRAPATCRISGQRSQAPFGGIKDAGRVDPGHIVCEWRVSIEIAGATADLLETVEANDHLVGIPLADADEDGPRQPLQVGR